MSTASLSLPNPPSSGIARGIRIFLSETRFEFTRMARTRTFSLSTIGFPVMFYCLFGLMLNRGQSVNGQQFAKYLLATYSVFGLVGASLFGIGVGLAGDLSAGWLELKRASPMPPLAYLLAKCCTAMAFGVIIVSILTLLGITFGNVHLSLHEYGRMIALTIIGAIPFASLGLALALLVPFNSAPAVANLVYLPMSFLGGLWLPLSLLPTAVQKIAPILPTYHLGQLMLGTFGYANNDSINSHWIGLVGFTCVMLGIAWITFSRREQNA